MSSPAQLAHMDLIPSCYVSHAVAGSFTSSGLQDEIAIARHDVIEIVRVADCQSWEVKHTEPLFGVVRAMACLPSSSLSQPDCLVVTSDSGCISVLRYDAFQRKIVPARPGDDGAFGKSGIRRTVPGHYLAVDPAGRVVMAAALEATKFVFPVRHVTDPATGAEHVALMSPIEVTRPSTVTFSLVALDTAPPLSAAQRQQQQGVASEGPCRFAALEAERKSAAPRTVVIYEFDSTLHTCNAVLSIPFDCNRMGGLTPPHSLVPIPAHLPHCPHGALMVCCGAGDEQVHTIIFKEENGEQQQQQQKYDLVDVIVPRRAELKPERDALLITGVAAYVRLGPKRLFFMLQNEAGDLFKIDFLAGPPCVVARYFDTVPVASAAIVLRKGGLLIFGEGGTSGLYKIINDGAKDDSYITATYQVEYHTSMLVDQQMVGVTVQREVRAFRKHEHLVNLELRVGAAAAMHSTHAPMLQMQLLPQFQSENSTEGRRFLTVRGKGAENSAVSLMRFGHKAHVLTTVGVSLPYDSAFALERHNVFFLSSSRHSSTLCFSTTDFSARAAFGHDESNSTLAMFDLPDNRGIVQVHRTGLRALIPAAAAQPQQQQQQQQQFTHVEWKHHKRLRLSCAAHNGVPQMIVAVENGGLMLFELDSASGRMRDVATNEQVDSVNCVAVAPPLGPSSKALLGAVGRGGTAKDFYFVWLVTLPPPPMVPGAPPQLHQQPRALQPVSNQRLKFNAAPVSCVFTAATSKGDGGENSKKILAIVGLEDGAVMRIPVDPRTGVIDPIDNWSEISVGQSPVRLVLPEQLPIQQQQQQQNETPHDGSVVMALSSPNSVWRLSVKDSSTNSQVPVSIFGDHLAAECCSYACPLRTSRLPSALILLNDRKCTMSIVSLDTAAEFYEQVLLRPATNCTLRRVGLTRDRSIGVVLHNEARSRAHSVIQVKAVSQIQQQQQQGGSSGAASSVGGAVRGRPDDLRQTKVLCNDDGESNNNGFSWSIESFSVERAVRRSDEDSTASTAAIVGGEPFLDHMREQQRRHLFDPAQFQSRLLGGEGPLPEAAVAMVMGTIRQPDGSTNVSVSPDFNFFASGGGNSNASVAEQIIVSVVPAMISAAPMKRGLNSEQQNQHLPPPMLYTFGLSYSGAIALMHRTAIDEVATSLHVMTASRWLVVGAGRNIAFYTPGRHQLLLKTTVPDAVPWKVVAMASSEDDVLCVCDAHESVFFFKVVATAAASAASASSSSSGSVLSSTGVVSGTAGSLLLQQKPTVIHFADDVVPRHLTCCVFVDPMTVAVADRFGCISLLRFTAESLAFATAAQNEARRASGNAPVDNSSAIVGNSESKRLKGAPRKVYEAAHFFVGQCVVSLDIETVTKAATSGAAAAAAGDSAEAGGCSRNNCTTLYYATSLGRIGALTPLSTDDYQHLCRVERILRSDLPPLLGRDHHSYRSSFGQSVGVVDIAYVQHAWRSKKTAVEQAVLEEMEAAQHRMESVGLPAVAARQLETGLSEIRARALGMVE